MTFISSPPVALTIAGSDSGGGAGIQADLRTFSFHRVHGTSALTCVTAQNTLGVTRVDALSPEAVIAQIEAVTSDIGVQAAKTGMLLNRPIIEAIAQHLQAHPIPQLVVDPVMVSRTGDKLIADEAIAALRHRLLPLATVLTPNRYEAQMLADMDIATLEDMRCAAKKKSTPWALRWVIVKGGRLYRRVCAVWMFGMTGDRLEVMTTERVDTPNTHGTGCTLSSAIAANLAQGLDPLAAAIAAKKLRHQCSKAFSLYRQRAGPSGSLLSVA